MDFLVDLNKVKDVKQFVSCAEKCNGDVLVRNRERAFLIDGKSIMGMFSLDLSRPVSVHVEDDNVGEKFKKSVSKLIVE